MDPSAPVFSADDARFMRRALSLAASATGDTSPNPLVGAVVVQAGKIIGEGWHHQAGQPHAEVEAIRQAQSTGRSLGRSTLYVTLEPCCTHGRTPPCTEAILKARIPQVVVAAVDPNPRHAGAGLELLAKAGVKVQAGLLADRSVDLNEGFHHWIVHRRPFVTLKSASTLDGKIATASGESKWITGERARKEGMNLRRRSDAILVGVNTIIADDPSLTWRGRKRVTPLRRVILDPKLRIPVGAQVLTDDHRAHTIIVTSEPAPKRALRALPAEVKVLIAPLSSGKLDLAWVMDQLGQLQIQSLLVEGGGETHAEFLKAGLAHRIVFFYAPLILGGRDSRKSVGGDHSLAGYPKGLPLHEVKYRWMGVDLMLRALIQPRASIAYVHRNR